eukprot:TRINITY_DN95134_c0_g1_i1.p1 TRINITY_DN95134_c0_g1~~TRINITY_DN95134_c0_g1_i1.p1  ORF type:complete len:348 (-),score=49.93 TRINITY_DN95134_c0_g1_i1:227-1138(-)
MALDAALAGSVHEDILGVGDDATGKYADRSRVFDILHRKQIEAEKKGRKPDMVTMRYDIKEIYLKVNPGRRWSKCCPIKFKQGPSTRPADPRFLLHVGGNSSRTTYVLGILDMTRGDWPPKSDPRFLYEYNFVPRWNKRPFLKGPEVLGSAACGDGSHVAGGLGTRGNAEKNFKKNKVKKGVVSSKATMTKRTASTSKKTSRKPAAPMRTVSTTRPEPSSHTSTASNEQVGREFTPSPIDVLGCLARTWNGGAGGQCKRRRCAGSEFCTVHAKQNLYEVHGRVDGPIPPAKLKDFQRAKQAGK